MLPTAGRTQEALTKACPDFADFKPKKRENAVFFFGGFEGQAGGALAKFFAKQWQSMGW